MRMVLKLVLKHDFRSVVLHIWQSYYVVKEQDAFGILI